MLQCLLELTSFCTPLVKKHDRNSNRSIFMGITFPPLAGNCFRLDFGITIWPKVADDGGKDVPPSEKSTIVREALEAISKSGYQRSCGHELSDEF